MYEVLTFFIERKGASYEQTKKKRKHNLIFSLPNIKYYIL